MDKVMNQQAALQDQIEAIGAWDLDHTVEMAMDALRCPPGDADVNKISGGERRRVALARLLLEKPDMLLLDEPTNHLDAESVAWLEKHLEQFGHGRRDHPDRYFLDNVAKWILELDRGEAPVRGQLLRLARAFVKRLKDEEKQSSARQQWQPRGKLEEVGARVAEGAAGQSKARLALRRDGRRGAAGGA